MLDLEEAAQKRTKTTSNVIHSPATQRECFDAHDYSHHNVWINFFLPHMLYVTIFRASFFCLETDIKDIFPRQ